MAKRKTATKTKKKLSWKGWAVIIAILSLLGAGGNANKAKPEENPTRAAVSEPAAPEHASAPTETPEPTPAPTPSPVPTPTPYTIRGLDPKTSVYVSRKGVIHSYSSCSQMKYYTEMTIEKADKAGYSYCEHCW